MKTLTLTRGTPGSGKSTFAEYLASLNGGVICCADDFFMKDGEYKWNPNQIGIAHGWCKNKCEQAMQEGKNVIVSNTLTTEKELKPYLTLANKFGYRVYSLIVENRHGGKNTHGVPADTISRMKDRFSIKL